MAVIQISRIQIRRGRQNEGSGVPQLASGEFGWAVDTQQLYIGNGAVSEGSPYVGNTEVLTEHTNLFEYASSYTYRSDAGYLQTGSTINGPVVRTLQERLDDRVSVRAFGCPGDGTDQTAALQRAIFQLFINDANRTNPQSRVVLYIEPGIYNISSTIYIPPYTTIVGAGFGKTIFRMTGIGPVFKTVNGTTTITSIGLDAVTTESNQSKYVSMSGFTVDMTVSNTAAFRLENCTRGLFRDIEVLGPWRTGNSYNANSVAFILNALSSAVNTSYNLFESVHVRGFAYGVYSKYDINNNKWNNCTFDDCVWGFQLGEDTILGNSGQLTGPSHNNFSNCKFDDIDREAIRIMNGNYNVSSNNKFFNAGNEGGSSINPLHPIITFANNTNLSENDWFQRSAELGYDLEFLYNVVFVPEVSGPVITQQAFTHSIQLGELGEYTKVAKFPADVGKSIELDYLYRSNQVQATRSGTIRITVDPTNDAQILSDDYDFIGDNSFAENLRFEAQNFDENGDDQVDTIALMVLNSTSSDDANLYFRVRTKS